MEVGSMRVLLVGCGGIGGVVAAVLTRAGVEIELATGNPAISAAIRAHGLRVRELDGSEWSVAPLRPPEVEISDRGGPIDLCLLATKTTTLDEALAAVRPRLHPQGQVVLLQNGLPEQRAEAILGSERVIGCVVGWGATFIEPGLSARTSQGGLQLGRRQAASGSDDKLASAVALLGRGFATQQVGNLAGVRWSKLAINCATSTLGAAGGDRLGALLRQRFVRRLTLEIWAELAAVARAEGIRLARVMGTLDIAKLAITDGERQRRLGSPGLLLKHSLLLGLGLKYRHMRSSMAVAIERGRQPEIDYLNGEIVRRGEALGIKTPVNRALCQLIHDIVAGRALPSPSTLYAVYQRHCTGPEASDTDRSPPPPLGSGQGRLTVDAGRRDVTIGERP
jgi:2-dehydropantoate 2-reductase